MGPYDYVVYQIDGDYARLRRLDAPEEDLKRIDNSPRQCYT